MASRTGELSRRSQVATLAAWGGSGDPPLQDLLAGEACEGRWRVVELISLSARPFDVLLGWTGGQGGNLSARLTISRGTRVGIYACSLTVRAANLAKAENTVVCNVSDSSSF